MDRRTMFTTALSGVAGYCSGLWAKATTARHESQPAAKPYLTMNWGYVSPVKIRGHYPDGSTIVFWCRHKPQLLPAQLGEHICRIVDRWFVGDVDLYLAPEFFHQRYQHETPLVRYVAQMLRSPHAKIHIKRCPVPRWTAFHSGSIRISDLQA